MDLTDKQPEFHTMYSCLLFSFSAFDHHNCLSSLSTQVVGKSQDHHLYALQVFLFHTPSLISGEMTNPRWELRASSCAIILVYLMTYFFFLCLDFESISMERNKGKEPFSGRTLQAECSAIMSADRQHLDDCRAAEPASTVLIFDVFFFPGNEYSF